MSYFTYLLKINNVYTGSRYYKYNVNCIKELLTTAEIKYIDDSIDELEYIEQFIEAAIKKLYHKIILI